MSSILAGGDEANECTLLIQINFRTMHISKYILANSLVFMVALSLFSANTSGGVDEVGQILEASEKKYGGLGSLSASGEVHVQFEDPNPDDLSPFSWRYWALPEKTSVKFWVKLKKPDLYLIRWLNSDRKIEEAVWHDTEAHYATEARRGTYFDQKSLELNLAGARGVSHQISHVIPRLFFGHEKNVFSCFRGAKLEREEIINGEIFYVLMTGKCGSDNVRRLWISKETHLIYKYFKRTLVDDGSADAFISQSVVIFSEQTTNPKDKEFEDFEYEQAKRLKLVQLQ